MPDIAQPHKSFATACVTRACAALLIDAAIEAARAIGFEPAVAVADATGHLKAFERSDGAPFLTALLAVDKAWTAASFGFPTHVWNELVADSTVAPLAHHPRLLAVGGGYPLTDDTGRLIGGIGVSGGTVDQDRQAAEAALQSVGFALQA